MCSVHVVKLIRWDVRSLPPPPKKNTFCKTYLCDISCMSSSVINDEKPTWCLTCSCYHIVQKAALRVTMKTTGP